MRALTSEECPFYRVLGGQDALNQARVNRTVKTPQALPAKMLMMVAATTTMANTAQIPLWP